MERGPIFVAGLERSGTSLIYALLASHPNIAMTRRTNLWKHFFGQYGDLRRDEDLDRCLATMRRYKRLVVLGTDFDRLRADFVAGKDRTYPRLFALLEEQYAERLGRPRWGDKSLNTEHFTERILGAYPGSRILHMIRDPRDRFASSMSRWGRRRGGVGAGTAEWLDSARVATRNERAHPDRYLVVRYEDLATAPEASLERICAFIDEPFVPEMLSMDGAAVFLEQGSNSSYGPRDRGVISTTSIGRFREVLSPRQIAFIQSAARDAMAGFGYDREPLRLRPPQRLRFAVLDIPVESAHVLAWRARERVRDRRGRAVPGYRLVDPEAAA